MNSRTRAANAAARRREALIIGQAILDLQNADSTKELIEVGQQLRRAALCFELSNSRSDTDSRNVELNNAAEALRLAALYLNRIVGWTN